MCYLFHHPLVPQMYSRSDPKSKTTLYTHFGRGDAEIKKENKGLAAYPDANLATDIMSGRSTTSTVHTWGDVGISLQCIKQPDIAASTNDAEVQALFQATKRTLLYRSILRSIDIPQEEPTPTYEDNAATIAQVMNNQLTPRVKHIDILIGWLHEQATRQRMKPIQTPSSEQKGDMNTKPHRGFTLQKKFLDIMGHKYYPPPQSEHHRLLQLDQFNINPHRGSFLKTNQNSIPNRK